MARKNSESMGSSEVPLVTFRGGWFLFAGGLTLSFVMALLFKSILSPSQIRYWIEEAIQKAQLPVQVEFTEARLEFAQGWWPWFGVVMDEIFVVSHDTCQSLSEFRTSQLRVSISLASILKKKIDLPQIYFGDSQIRYLPGSCESSSHVDQVERRAQGEKLPSFSSAVAQKKEGAELPPSPSAIGEQNKSAEKLALLRNQYIRAIEIWKTKVSPFVGSVIFSHLDIVSGQEPDWKMGLEGLSINEQVEGDQSGIGIRGNFAFDLIEAVGVSTSLASGRSLALDGFFSSEQSQFKLIGNYKEGHVDWQGKVNWKPLTTELSLNQDQIPLGPLWQILTRRHVIKSDIQPKYLWLTCALKYSGKILDLETHPLAVEPCSLDGDIGNIAVDRGHLYPWRKPPFDPFKLKLKDLDLQKLLAMFQRSGLSGILSRYGLIDGELQVETPEQMKFTGKIRQLEMAFSNRGVRGKQAVPELKGELLLNGDRVSGNLFEMDLAGGEFKGQMTFNMDRQFRNGAIQLAIDRLRFNHSIQNLMVGGEIDQISAFGHGQIEDGELSNWKGDFGVLSLRGADWGLEKAKLSTELSQNVFSSIVSIKKVSLMAGEGFFRLLKPLLLEEENLENEATLVNLTGRLRLSKKSGKWEKVKAFSAAKTQLTSEGSWDETRSIKGLVKVISPPSSRPLTWEIGGDLDHMQLSPTAQTLKEFKQTHPELKAPETVDFIRAGELLVHEISAQGVEKIKSFGEKVIETARKIIPEESPSPPAPVGETNSK